MFSKLSIAAIALAVFSTSSVALTESAFVGPSGLIQNPLVLHRDNGTHRVTFVGSCVVEFDRAYVVTGNNGLCTAERLAIAQDIVALQVPEPYVTDIQVVRGPLAATN